MLNDETWGLARYARPEWQSLVGEVASDLATVAKGYGAGPRFATLAAALAGADSIYDVCGSETKEMALADAASAVALYSAQGRVADAANAHLWGWVNFGSDRAAILAAQASARN